MTKQPKKGFINESGLDFVDISAESVREYTLANGRKLKIQNPQFLNVSESGGHRLYCKDGWSYYVKPSESWFIRWQSKTGNPNFVK